MLLTLKWTNQEDGGRRCQGSPEQIRSESIGEKPECADKYGREHGKKEEEMK